MTTMVRRLLLGAAGLLAASCGGGVPATTVQAREPTPGQHAPTARSTPLPPAPPTIELDVDAASAQEIQVSLEDAARRSEQHDPTGCLESLGRAARENPRLLRTAAYWLFHSGCLIQADRCDEGVAEYRAYIKAVANFAAASGQKPSLTDHELDELARDAANKGCSSATAENDIDYVVRAARELLMSAQSADARTCRTRADALAARASKLGESAAEQRARSKAQGALDHARSCALREARCQDALAITKHIVRLASPNAKDIDVLAAARFDDLLEHTGARCK